MAKKNGIRLKFAWLAFWLALLIPVWFVSAALGSKYGLWGWQFGLGTMTVKWGPMLVIGVLGFSGLIFLSGLFKAPRFKIAILTLLAMTVSGLALGKMLRLKRTASTLPPIHDVQTDWSDPIHFSETIMKARAEVPNVNPVEDDPVLPEGLDARWPGMGGKRVAEIQKESYQAFNTYIDTAPPDVMYAAAYSTIAEMGMQIVTADEAGGRIEATYTSRWFGFKDDVAVRIRPKGEGSQIDIRSISRVGLSDMGANAERVHSILDGIRARLGLAVPEE